MRRRFFTLDVFTDERFAGNPLAVVLEPDGLDTAAMQTIAREFNLSGNGVRVPAGRPKHRAQLRIFTPARELPFAGHPTVGTAVLLAHLDGGAGAREFVLAEEVGPVACRGAAGRRRRPRYDLPFRNCRSASARCVMPAKLAAALGLKAADIGFGNFAPAHWTAGNSFAFVPVRDLDAIGRARPDMSAMGRSVRPRRSARRLPVLPGGRRPAHSFHARMFAPAMGILEDPATGSAVAAFAGVLARPASATAGTTSSSSRATRWAGRA